MGMTISVLMRVYLKFQTVLICSIPIMCLMFSYVAFRFRPKLVFLFDLVCIGLIAVYYQPLLTDDLHSVFNQLEMIRVLGWDGLNGRYVNSTYFAGAKLYFLYLWVFSFFPNSVIKITSVVLIYALIGNLVHRISRDYGVTKNVESSWITYVFLVLNLYLCISSFRHLIAAAALMNLFYEDMVKQRHRILCFILYFVIGFFHTIAFMLLAFRLMGCFFSRRGKWIAAGVILSHRLLVSFVLAILSRFTGSVVLNEIATRISYYSQYKEPLQLPYHIAMILYAVTFLYLMFKCRKKDGKVYEQIDATMFCIAMFAFSRIGSISMVFRFVYVLMMITPLYFARFRVLYGRLLSSSKVTMTELYLILSAIVVCAFYIMRQYGYLFNQF